MSAYSLTAAILARDSAGHDGKIEAAVEIVGVVKDAKFARLRREMPATVYSPCTQRPYRWPQEMSFEVRVTGDASAAFARIRRAMAEIDPMLPLTEV